MGETDREIKMMLMMLMSFIGPQCGRETYKVTAVAGV